MLRTPIPGQPWSLSIRLSRYAVPALLAFGLMAGTTQAEAAFPPPGRFGHTAVRDSLRGRIVVFGGADPTSHNDVWAFPLSDTSGWNTLSPTGTPPSPRQGHSAVYDPVRDRIVVFGGFDAGSGYRGDVWTLSLSGTPEWSGMSASGAHPSPRGFHAAVYDPVRGRLLVFGGQDAISGSLNDVWELSLSGNPAWRTITPAGSPPSARYGHTAIYDPIRDRVVVFGGYDAKTGSRNDTWELSLSGTPAWKALDPSGHHPAGRHGHTAIYDAAKDRMVVFGGRDGYAARNDVWMLSLAGQPKWSATAHSDSAPSVRSSHATVYDPAHNRMVLFGGTDAGPADDVWALSLSETPAWSAVAPAEHPSNAKESWPFTIGLQGGSAIPSGDFGDPELFAAKPGLHLGASIDHMFSARLAIGLDGSYNTHELDLGGADPVVASSEDQYTTIQFGIHANYLLPLGRDPWSLWLQLGAGGYNLSEEWSVTYNNGAPPTSGTWDVTNGWRPGAKAGARVGYRASKLLTFGVGADYNYIFLDQDYVGLDLSSAQFINVHAGVEFHLGSK